MILKAFRKDHLFKNIFLKSKLKPYLIVYHYPKTLWNEQNAVWSKNSKPCSVKNAQKHFTKKIFKYDKITYCSSIINNRR